MKTIYTNNQGKLKTIEPFNYLRGVENKDKSMGLAENEKGDKFEIYPAPCDIDNGLTSNCYCFSTAVKIEQQ